MSETGSQPPDIDPPREMTAEEEERHSRGRLPTLCLGALGVVYGDIGTSPLYALRESFHQLNTPSPSPEDVLGILSLILWSLIIVISVKYLLLIMRADNRGEGGILALAALLQPWRAKPAMKRTLLIALSLAGAALMYGDGMITPAISVLSAVEGLAVAAPETEGYVVPITVVILVLLFLLQSRGSGSVGAVFGPVMLVWFSVLALLGVGGMVRAPEVLAAINPWHAASFFFQSGLTGFVVLGAVFLVTTGGEALYADMGHFGRLPIRLAWYGLVLPALLLNYFGQGALLLHDPARVAQPFYQLAPGWALYPLVVLATAATVIASQALISGVFTLTRQAVLLGLSPRMEIVQTSSEEAGQVYSPALNWILMVATIALVLGFGSSTALAGAYGIAISTTMVITTVLIFFIMRERWKWSPLLAAFVAATFLTVDLAFFGSNLLKITDGGWVPIVAAVLVFTIMSTWRRGREILFGRLDQRREPITKFLERIAADPPVRVPGTGIFLTDSTAGTPPVLLHHLAHNKVLHERVILLTVTTEEEPRIPAAGRLEVEDLDHGFYRVFVHYGFMQSPDVPVALRLGKEVGLEVDIDDSTFYVGRETPIPTENVLGMMLWREKLFAFMNRVGARADAFYKIPPQRVVELGIQVEV